MNSAVLNKTAVYLALLLIGYGGKRRGIFRREDTRFISTLVLNLTMPAAVINGFQGVQVRPVLLWALGVGFTANLILILLGQLLCRKAGPRSRVACIFCVSAFNVANFAMPFLTGLVTPDGFAALCLFDIFGVITSYGVNMALAEACMGGEGKLRLQALLRKILTTPVILTYLVLVVLSVARVQLPGAFLELTGVIGGANAFLAMLSIGILFEVKLPKADRGLVLRVLGIRYGVCLAVLAVIAAVLPLPGDLRTALCVVVLAPCASSSPMLTEVLGGDGSLAAAISSLSVPISITMMTLALTLL